MKTLFFSLLLIGSGFLSNLMAADPSIEELKEQIRTVHYDIFKLTRAINSTSQDPSYLDELRSTLSIAQTILMNLLDEHERITGASFVFPNTFTTTYVVSKSQETQADLSKLKQIEKQIRSNIHQEQTHLAELKALLTQPEYQDKTDFYTQELLQKITESIEIITYYKECLIKFMYLNRSEESLMNEAQQNCLGSVKLTLHDDCCFCIPRLVRKTTQ